MAEGYCVSRNQIEAALAALAQAGKRLIAGQLDVPWHLKADGTFVTVLDKEIQESLKDPLCKIFPASVFVAEEDASPLKAAREPKPRLVLDPIDGTAAFVRGFNFFSISLAVINSDGEPQVGIVYMPARRKCYAAAREAGGWVSYAVSVVDCDLKAKPLQNPDAKRFSWKLEDTYVYVSSGAHRQLEMSAFKGKIRAFGASASHLALLLDHTPDPGAVILTQYKLWDAIAGLALARAMGLEIRDLRRPAGNFAFPDFVNELVNLGKCPPLVVGAGDIIDAVIRTVKHRGEPR